MHLPPSGEATLCVGRGRRLCVSLLHLQCQVVLFETARVVGRHGSWKSVDPPNIMTVCKAFVYWVGPSTCRTDGEIVRSDWLISLDTWSQRQAQRHRRRGSDQTGSS